MWKLNLVLLGKSHFLREQNLCCTLFCCWGEEDRWWTRVLCNYFRRWRGNIFDTSNHPLISRYNKIIWIYKEKCWFFLVTFICIEQVKGASIEKLMEEMALESVKDTKRVIVDCWEMMLMLMFRDDVDYQVGAADDRTRCKFQISRMQHRKKLPRRAPKIWGRGWLGLRGLRLRSTWLGCNIISWNDSTLLWAWNDASIFNLPFPGIEMFSCK